MALLARTREGRPIHVDPDDERGRRLVDAEGDLNPPSLELWRIALGLDRWRVVVDVGANYGEMLVGALLPADARVIAFEPNPAVRTRLATTLDDNGVAAEVRAEAVSDRSGRVGFQIDTAWSGTSSLDPGGPAAAHLRTVEVDAVTLDDVLGDEAGSVCIKVDVEGEEVAVLRGARRLLDRLERWAVVAEVLHLPVGDVAALAAAHAMFLLDRRTSRLVRVPGGNRGVTSRMLATQWLYPQDCLLVSPALVPAVAGTRP